MLSGRENQRVRVHAEALGHFLNCLHRRSAAAAYSRTCSGRIIRYRQQLCHAELSISQLLVRSPTALLIKELAYCYALRTTNIPAFFLPPIIVLS